MLLLDCRAYSGVYCSLKLDFGLMLNCFSQVRSGENIIRSGLGRGHKIYYFWLHSGWVKRKRGIMGSGCQKLCSSGLYYTFNPLYFKRSFYLIMIWGGHVLLNKHILCHALYVIRSSVKICKWLLNFIPLWDWKRPQNVSLHASQW